MAIEKYKTKAGIRYKAELYRHGKKVASKRGFETKRDAKKWLADTGVRVEEQEHQATVTTFSALATLYLDDVQARRQKNTYTYKRATCRRLLAFQGDFQADKITPTDIDAYLLHRRQEQGAKAANRDLRELKAVYNWGIARNLFQTNPFRPIEPFAEEQFVRRIPSAEEIALVRMAAQGDERDFIDCLYYTAGRLSEICRLTWEDVNLELATIRLWTRKRRGGSLESRVQGMPPDLVRILERRWKVRPSEVPYVFYNQDGSKLHRNSRFVKFLFQRVCERAGIAPFTAHCIRHHVATLIKDSRKATPWQIKTFLGHKRLSTTEVYLHELDVDRDILTVFNSSNVQAKS